MIEINTKVSGRFKVGVIRPDGKYEDRADWFNNLIVDDGLDLLMSGTAGAATAHCGAGAGSTPPANGQTGLVSSLGSRSETGTVATSTSGGAPAWFQSLTRVYTFAVGAVVGNVAELGVFNLATGGKMFSRALIKDGGGNPTTISVLADEQLVVTYELRKYPPTADVTGTVSITVDGTATDYNYTLRAANVDETAAQAYWQSQNGFARDPLYAYAFETQALGAITAAPSGTSAGATTSTLAAYTNGNFYRDTTNAWSTGAGNFASGIGSVVFSGPGASVILCGYQVNFTPRLPKTNTKTLSLTFRVSVVRYVA
jgi:hypothetical protein